MLKTALYRICFQLLITVTRLLFGLPLSSRGETRVQSYGALQVNEWNISETTANQRFCSPNYSNLYITNNCPDNFGQYHHTVT